MEKARGLRGGRAGQRSAGARETQLSQELNSRHKGGQTPGSCLAAVSGAQPARVVEAGLLLPPFPSPLQGLFRSEPWESVSPVEVISLESARRGCKSPPPPPHPTSHPQPAALWSQGGGAGTPGGAGLGSRPPEARGRSWIGRLRRGGGG